MSHRTIGTNVCQCALRLCPLLRHSPTSVPKCISFAQPRYPHRHKTATLSTNQIRSFRDRTGSSARSAVYSDRSPKHATPAPRIRTWGQPSFNFNRPRVLKRAWKTIQLPMSLRTPQESINRRRTLILRKALRQNWAKVTSKSRIITRRARSEQWMMQMERSLYPYTQNHMYWVESFRLLFVHKGNVEEVPRQLQLPAHAKVWADEILQEGDVRAMRQKWKQTCPRLRRTRWPAMMLSSLTRSAKDSLLLLFALYEQPQPAYEMVMDCLLYLKRVRWKEITIDPDLMSLYDSIVAQERRPERWPLQGPKPRHLDILLEEASLEDGRQMMNEYKAETITGNWWHMLRFMDFFTKAHDIDYAVDCFNLISPGRRAHPLFLQRCTNLLELDTVEVNGVSKNFRILPQLLSGGLRPNLIIHNVVIKNAFKAGVPGVGWDLFHFLKEQGLPTDARTYLALMQDTLVRQDISGLEEILSAMHQREDLARNPHLIICTMQVIRCIYLSESHISPSLCFSRMLAVYSRAFSVAPLLHLGIINNADATVENIKLPEPAGEYLGFVMWSYVLIQTNTRTVDRLWAHTQRLLADGDRTVSDMAQHDVFYNAFLMYYGRIQSELPRCLDILQFMLNNEHCQPTALTWSVVMLGFLKHGQEDGAEIIRVMMLDRGLLPNKKALQRILQQHPGTSISQYASALIKDLEDTPEHVKSLQIKDTGQSQLANVSESLEPLQLVPKDIDQSQGEDAPEPFRVIGIEDRSGPESADSLGTALGKTTVDVFFRKCYARVTRKHVASDSDLPSYTAPLAIRRHTENSLSSTDEGFEMKKDEVDSPLIRKIWHPKNFPNKKQ